ncbi:hypothetical protein [Gehongia tenuis]|uniref:Uncharacterized protein n=1 Tax=Gehongia tenuis TaxID=2763655 RepID=A0A926D5J1_9FIRM|nr:hypothetical protein [Gehongia tenuis]MBC8531789.1 hypothetical protein [Gehongia tenuis]
MTETALAIYKDFALISDQGIMGDMSPEEMDEMMEDIGNLPSSYARIKIPAGGALQFEIPNADQPDNPDYAQELTGVILYHHPANAYWADADSATGGTPPDCASSDGRTGVPAPDSGLPGGACAECPLNVMGSGEGGRGKACKNMHQIYILRSGEIVPVVLSLPPTSLKAFGTFVRAAFLARRQRTSAAVASITLKRVESGGNKYSVAAFRVAGWLPQEQAEETKRMAQALRATVRGEAATPGA